jgi:hypothetical protein
MRKKRNTKKTNKNCLICHKDFIVHDFRKNIAKYCSKICYQKSKIGIKLSDKIKSNMKGSHKGFKHSKESLKKIRLNIPSKEKHYNWRGGRTKTSGGYILVTAIGHPFATNRRYIFEHRLVMEKKIGRYLTKLESVHHINGIKDDNRIENLELVVKGVHYGKIDCPFCKQHFLIR